jgi:uncharacterized membrane protein YebE (DUF533 family)
MCPACLATMVMIAGSLASTGGLAVIVVKKFRDGKSSEAAPAQIPSKEDQHG